MAATTVLTAAGAADAGATAPTTELSLVALAGQAAGAVTLHAGFVDPVAIEVRNDGTAATSESAATATVTLPAGVTLTKLSTYSTQGNLEGPAWSCHVDHAHHATCQLEGTSTSPLSSLKPGQAVVLVALLRNNLPAGSSGTLHLDVNLPGAATSSVTLPVNVITNGVTGVTVVRQAVPEIGLGSASAIQLALLNSSSTTVTYSASAPAVLSNLLPAGLVTSWSTTSSGWSCTGAQNASPSCALSGTITPRTTSAPLVLSYTTATSSPLLSAAHTSAPLSWTSGLALPGPYGEQETSSFNEHLELESKLALAIGVEVRAIGGTGAASDSIKTIDVNDVARFGAPSGVTDTVVIPKHTWASPVAMNGWTCPGGTGTMTCTHPAPVVSSDPFGFSIDLHVSSVTTLTFGLVAVEAAITGSHARNANFVFLSLGVKQGNDTARSTTPHPATTTPKAPTSGTTTHPVTKPTTPPSTPPTTTPTTPPTTKPKPTPTPTGGGGSSSGGSGSGSGSGSGTSASSYVPPMPFNTNYLSRDIGGQGSTRHFTQGPGNTTGLYDPGAMAVAPDGNIYFVDDCMILKEYVTNKYVGWFGGLYNADQGGFCGTPKAGSVTSTELNPAALAVEPNGDVLEADNSGYVTRITPSGTLSIIAGNGSTAAPVAGSALSSPLANPSAITEDSSGNIYLACNYTSTQYVYIVKITPAGQLSIVYADTLATKTTLTATSSGPASSFGLEENTGLAVDASGNLAVSVDYTTVVQITPSGQLSVLAGNGSFGTPRQTPGSPTSTSLRFAVGLNYDAQGNLYIADVSNILEVTPGGVMFPVAGNGGYAFYTYGPATQTPMEEATSVVADPNGSVYYTDAASAAVMQVYRPTGPPTSPVAVPGNASATVSFNGPATYYEFPATSYTVTAVDLTNSANGGQTATGTSSPVVITGLTNGDQYLFTVAANSYPGASTAAVSAAVTPSTVPDAPLNPSAVGGVAAATISWSVPKFNGGIPITGYTASDGQGHTCTTTTLSCTITGITPGQTYFFTVVATNADGNSVASDETYAYLPPTVPDAPTKLSVTVSGSSATGTWLTPDFDGGIFIASYTLSDGVGDTCSTTTLSCEIDGLTPGQTYTFTVVASNSVGDSQPSSAAQATIAPVTPDDPSNVTVTGGLASATVSWGVPDFDGGSAITQYLVSDGQGDTCSTAGLQCTVTGLVPGQSYTFTVIAVNVVGDSPGQDAQQVTIDAVAPNAPTGVTVSVSGTSAIISFVAPSFDGGEPITGYTVDDGVGDTCTTTTLSCEIDGLTPGQTYTFSVVATNAVGDSTPSSPAQATIPAVAPLSPGSVTATSGAGSATITWAAPSYDGGAAITSYTVSDGQGDTCTTTALSCTITGLTDGQSYTFTVTATNSAGTSPSSAASAPVVPATTPNAPVSVTATAGVDSATIAWTAPSFDGGSAITSYTVTDGQGDTCTTATLSCTITGLVAGQSYTFTVTATNAVGTSSASTAATVTPVAAPGAPTSVTAVVKGTSVTITWVAPTFDGGAAITGYTVTDGQGDTCTTTSLSCTITGLIPGQHYSFTVTASNFAASGASSSPATAAIAPVVPGAPANVTATSTIKNLLGTATISWDAPAFDGGSPITSYTVTGPGGLSCTTTTLSCSITGLVIGKAYTFTVVAKNAVGTSPASSPVQVTPLLVPIQDGTNLGGFVLSNIVEIAGSTSTTFKGTVTGTFSGLSLTATLSFTDLHDWSLTASGAGFHLGSTTIKLTGAITDTASVLSGSFTAAIVNPISIDGAISLTAGALSIADHAGAITVSSPSLSISVGSLTIPVGYNLVDLHDWSISANATTASFDGGTLSFSGTLTDAAGSVSGSLTAQIASSFTLGGGVSLTAGSITVADHAGTVTVGGTGITLAVGTALSLPVSFNYTDSSNWSISATAVTASFEGVSLSFSGSLAEAAGVVSGSLTASISTPIALGGGITLPSGSLTIADNAGALSLNGSNLTLAVGSAISLPIGFTATGLKDWTISDTNVPVSFDGATLDFSGSLTDTAGTLSGSLTAQVASPLVLGGGASITAGSISISDQAGNITVNGSNLTLALGTSVTLPISFTYADSSDWSLSATNATASFDGGTLSFTGNVTETAGAISGALTAAIASPLSLGGGVSLTAGSITVSDQAGTISIGGASITLAVGTALMLPITLHYVDLSDWTVGATNQTVSFDGGTLSFSGTLTDAAGTLSGSLTAQVASPINLGGGVSLTAGSVTISDQSSNLTFGGTNVTISVGKAFSLPISFSYTDSHDWTVTATNATASFDGGSVAFNGALVDTAGALAGALSASIASPLELAGSASITAGTITVSVAKDVFVVTGKNLTLAIGSSFTLPISFSYADSHDWTISVTNATASFGSGTLSFTGKLSDVGTVVSGSITAQIASPLTLGGGIGFTAGSLSIDDASGTFSISGTNVTLAIGSAISLPISFTSTDAQDWTIGVTNVSTSFDGVNLSFSGSLTDAAGTISGKLTATLVHPISLGSGVSLTEGSLTVSDLAGTVTVSGTNLTLAVGKGLTLPISFTYNDSHDWTISATNVAVSFEGVKLSFSGTLTDAASTISGSLTATLVSPITLGDGVSLTAGSLSISDNAGSITLAGTNLTLSLASTISIPISFTYTDAKDWSITATASSSTGSVPFAAGLSLPLSSLQGTVSEHAGALSWSLSASLGTAPISLIPDLVTLTDARVSVGSSCAPVAGITLCGGGASSTVYFSVSGLLQLSIGSVVSTNPIPFGAAYGVGSGAFDMVALLPSISFSGIGISLSLKDPVLKLSYNDPTFGAVGTAISVGAGTGQTGGFNFSASGTISFQIGSSAPATLNATLTYAKSGFALIASFNPSSIASGMTGVALNGLVLTEAATSVVANGATFAVPAESIVLVGNYSLPSWLTQALNLGSTQVALFGSFTSATNFSFSVVIPDQFSLPSIDGYSFTFTGGLHIAVSYVEPNLTVSISQSGIFSIPAQSGQAAQQIPISFSGSYANGTVTVAISAGTQGSSQVIWANAMGVQGLNLTSISIALGVTTGDPIPDFGIEASGSLPPAVLQLLGINAGSGVPVTFAINVSATNPCLDATIGTPGGGNTISMAGGIITASYAQFVAAPDGCSIGNFTLQPGFSIAFNGTFFNIGVQVNATIGVNPFSLQAHVNIQGFMIGPFSINNPQLSLSLGPNGNSASFSGAIQLGTTVSIQISGSFGPGSSYSFTGASTINVLGFNLQTNITVANSSVSVKAVLNVPNLLYINFTGSYTGTNDLQLSGSAQFDPGGFTLGQFQFSLNTATQTFTGSAYVNIGSLLSGSASVTITNANGQVGFNVTFGASFNLANIVSASATVDIGNCSGSCTSVGSVQGSFNGTLTWAGQNIGFSGSFNSSGGFSLSVYSSVNLNTGVIDTGLVEFQGSLQGSYKITISSSAPYVYVSASMSASLQAAGIQVNTTCNPYFAQNCVTTSTWGSWATLASVAVSVDTEGNVYVNVDGVSFSIKL